MRSSARAIIIHDNKILLIHRIKEGKEYYVISGGGIEKGETSSQTVVREIKEEVSLDIVINKQLGMYMNGDDPITYFLVTTFTGEVKLGGEEKDKTNKDNQYIPEWISITDINAIPLFPPEAIAIIQKLCV